MNKDKLYCGIDLHKNFSMVCVMRQDGILVDQKKLQNTGEELKSYFTKRESMECVLEPVDNWGWLSDYLMERGHNVHLANVYKVRLIAESRMKTDQVDAKVLADLLRTGYLPEAYVAPKELRDTRTYLRYRITLTRERARLKNQIKKLLRVENIKDPFKDTFGKKGSEWLRNLKLRSIHNRIKEERMSAIEYYSALISKIDSELKENSKTDENIKLLMTVPGIGKIGAHLIMAEAGDIKRFKYPAKFAGYTGLVSSLRSSADKFYRGHITKQGSAYLRWILVEAAQKAKTADYNLNRFFNRIAFRRGKSIATVALARKLAEICWHILVDHVPYNTNKVCSRFG